VAPLARPQVHIIQHPAPQTMQNIQPIAAFPPFQPVQTMGGYPIQMNPVQALTVQSVAPQIPNAQGQSTVPTPAVVKTEAPTQLSIIGFSGLTEKLNEMAELLKQQLCKSALPEGKGVFFLY